MPVLDKKKVLRRKLALKFGGLPGNLFLKLTSSRSKTRNYKQYSICSAKCAANKIYFLFLWNSRNVKI